MRKFKIRNAVASIDDCALEEKLIAIKELQDVVLEIYQKHENEPYSAKSRIIANAWQAMMAVEIHGDALLKALMDAEINLRALDAVAGKNEDA